MSPFNDSVERPSIKKKPAASRSATNLVKITTLGILGFGVIIANALLPITPGENILRDTVNVLAGIETTANCTGTGCIQPIVGITETMDLYNTSGSYVIGKPSNPICELSATGALQGSACVITAGVTIIGASGITQAAADARYVNTSGDTMTGKLTIDLTTGYLALNVRQTVSGAYIFAQKGLSTSGALVVLGQSNMKKTLTMTNGAAITMTGAQLSATGSFRRQLIFPLTGSGVAAFTGTNVFGDIAWRLGTAKIRKCWSHLGQTASNNLTTTNIKINGTTIYSTLSTLDAGEKDVSTAATPSVINTAANTLAQNDVITVDVLSPATTPGKNLSTDCIVDVLNFP